MLKSILRLGLSPRERAKPRPRAKVKLKLKEKLKEKPKVKARLMQTLMLKLIRRPRASSSIKSKRLEKVWLRELQVERLAHPALKR